jgi:hypothetical protein
MQQLNSTVCEGTCCEHAAHWAGTPSSKAHLHPYAAQQLPMLLHAIIIRHDALTHTQHALAGSRTGEENCKYRCCTQASEMLR